ncbi:MAG: carboxymuconolactone decarboxylase family protein [Clostridia bacterium]
MSAFIKTPSKIPGYLKIGLWISKKATGMDLLVPKLLAWYPKVAISSGVLELLVAHGKKDLSARILQLVRIQTSLAASCPFCLDMNSYEYEKNMISKDELAGLQGKIELASVATFSNREKIALNYVKAISQTPISIAKDLVTSLQENFTEREIVILASTAAQVNYWARLIQALGVPPAGFSNKCER